MELYIIHECPLSIVNRINLGDLFKSLCVDSTFLLDAFPLDNKTHFFHLFGENLLFRKRLGIATYFCFILFLNGKQNKKEKP